MEFIMMLVMSMQRGLYTRYVLVEDERGSYCYVKGHNIMLTGVELRPGMTIGEGGGTLYHADVYGVSKVHHSGNGNPNASYSYTGMEKCATVSLVGSPLLLMYKLR